MWWLIATSCYERCLLTVALLQFEAEHATVEGECAVEIGDLEMDVSDACFRMDRLRRELRFNRV